MIFKMKNNSNIKIIEKYGKLPGKNVVVLAGIHGNESFGVEMLKELIPKLKIVSGKVIFIFANLEAIKQNKRFIEANLNRCFFKKQTPEIAETLEGKTAREIMPYLDKAELMLDIHASFTKESKPFIICQPQSFEIAKMLPFEIISWNWDEFEPGSTDYYMNLQNKIGICVECGYMKDPEARKRGKKALMIFLAEAGIINKKRIKLIKKYLKIVDLYKNKKGIFKKARFFSDFEKLTKKELVGFDGDKKIFADKDDYLLLVTDTNQLGDECFLIAEETLLNQNELNHLKRMK
jgi:succinylglutamate desuccinylase